MTESTCALLAEDLEWLRSLKALSPYVHARIDRIIAALQPLKDVAAAEEGLLVAAADDEPVRDCAAADGPTLVIPFGYGRIASAPGQVEGHPFLLIRSVMAPKAVGTKCDVGAFFEDGSARPSAGDIVLHFKDSTSVDSLVADLEWAQSAAQKSRPQAASAAAINKDYTTPALAGQEEEIIEVCLSQCVYCRTLRGGWRGREFKDCNDV